MLRERKRVERMEVEFEDFLYLKWFLVRDFKQHCTNNRDIQGSLNASGQKRARHIENVPLTLDFHGVRHGAER